MHLAGSACNALRAYANAATTQDPTYQCGRSSDPEYPTSAIPPTLYPLMATTKGPAWRLQTKGFKRGM